MQKEIKDIEPQYSFWLAYDTWEPSVAIGMIGGLEPNSIQYELNAFYPKGIKYYLPPGKEYIIDFIQIMETWFSYPVPPFQWIEKAIKSGIELPQNLLNEVKKKVLKNYNFDKDLVNLYPAIANLSDLVPKKGINQDFNENERRSLLKLILGMAIDKYGYDPSLNRNQASGGNKNSIRSSLEKISDELVLDEDTIRKYLEEARKEFPNVKSPKS